MAWGDHLTGEIAIRSGRAEDIPEVLELIDQSFRFRYYGGIRENPDERDLFDHLYHRPDFRPEWLVVGEADGRIVSVVGSLPRPAYIGGATVASWVLSPAATLNECRGRGYMVRLISELERQVVARGGTLIFLHGVPDYYPRAGYLRCLPHYEVVITAEHATKGSRGPDGSATLETAKFDDAPALAAIWDREAARGCLAMVRGPEWWQREMAIDDVKKAVPEGVTVQPADWRPNVRIGPDRLTRLALGCVPPGEDLLTWPDLPRAARHVLSVLFPPGYPDPGQYTF
ncbi:MAG: GNAT family N-acetyltransferase [Bacillota bacterium]